MIIKASAVILSMAVFTGNAFAYSCGGPNVSVKEKCQCVEEVREDIRSRQRVKSTQALRDDYNFWTKVHDSECRKTASWS